MGAEGVVGVGGRGVTRLSIFHSDSLDHDHDIASIRACSIDRVYNGAILKTGPMFMLLRESAVQFQTLLGGLVKGLVVFAGKRLSL